MPADLRVLTANGLAGPGIGADRRGRAGRQGLGTGAADAALGDRFSMLHAGTLVTYGSGSGIVVATGKATELGRVTSLLAGIEPLTTPLIQQTAAFGRRLSLGILVLAAATLLFGWLVRHYPLPEMFMAAVGLAVAAIPEGLPAIMTITLAIGVTRMARRNAIVRRLPAIETLGAVTVICSDKTGTLTRNEMTVQRVVTAGAVYGVEGEGYAPEGNLCATAPAVDPAAEPDLRGAGAGRRALQRERARPRRWPLAGGRQPDRRRAARARRQGRAAPPDGTRASPATVAGAVRLGAQVHGEPARREAAMP